MNLNLQNPHVFEAPGRERSAADGLGPLSALEEALDGDASGRDAALDRAREQLAQIEQQAEQGMSRGSAPAEFVQFKALQEACQTAREILNTYSPKNRDDARLMSK